jgi:hypothetical protein
MKDIHREKLEVIVDLLYATSSSVYDYWISLQKDKAKQAAIDCGIELDLINQAIANINQAIHRSE